jgi:hypothetical protein
MKKIISLLLLCTFSLLQGQAYKGKGDIKVQVGGNFQDGGSGIHATTDFGLGQNMSYGIGVSYLLNASEGSASDVDFEDRIDLKARFNANIGDVIGLDKKMDFYPGLDLSLKNFGAHLGFRYFFTDGFGVYAETGLPIAKYNSNAIDYNNQIYFNLGASFNL